MSTSNPEVLHGSCHCRSITYTITIPAGPRPLSYPEDPTSFSLPYVWWGDGVGWVKRICEDGCGEDVEKWEKEERGSLIKK